MLMRTSTHDRIVRELRVANTVLQIRLAELQKEWNALVKRINKKGGEEFLTHGRVGVPEPLSADDITRLLMLCHPDKHDGKPMAVEMTQRLLELRK